MAKMSIKHLLGLAKAEPASTAEAQDAQQAAATEVRAAEAGFVAAEAAYSTGLLSADDASLRALADARTDAQVRLDRAHALQVALDAKVEITRERERKTEVACLVSDYKTAAAAFRSFVETELPAMGATARRMMELRLAAEQARTTAQVAMHSADPEGAAVLDDVEAWRSASGLPEEILGEREIELWLRPNGTPIPEEHEREVKLQADGTGIRWHGGQSTHYLQRRRFLRRERLDQGHGSYAPPIATMLSIPPVTALDQAGWVPLKDADLSSLATALQRLQAGKIAMPDDREIKVTYEPIGEPINVFVPRVEVTGGPGQEPARRLG